MNVSLFLLGIMAIFEILNVFFNNKLKIFILGGVFTVITLYYTFNSRHRLHIYTKLLLAFFIIYYMCS